jgi:peptidoglycan/xylan/chitin deacetylase (PgdA/CDA1 family)
MLTFIRLLSALICVYFAAATSAVAAMILSKDAFVTAQGGGWSVPLSEPSATSWKRVGTEGNNNPVLMLAKTEPIDLSRKIINFRCRINSIDYLQGIEIRFSKDKKFSDYYAIKIPLYADETFNLLQGNAWHNLSFGLANAHIVGSPSDTQAEYIEIYLQDNNRAPLIFDFTDFDFREAKHDAIVSYTFDDGWADLVVAAEIMKEYGHVGTAYIIPSGIDTAPHLTLDQLKKLANDGWGIASHDKVTFVDLPAPRLIDEINQIYRYLDSHGFGGTMRHLAYPEGRQNRTYVLPIVRNAFASARIASGGLETLPPGDWWLLRVYNVLPPTTVADLRTAVEQAKAHGQWLILMFHQIVKEPQNDMQYPLERFREVVKMIAEENIAVQPVHKVRQLFPE